MYYLRFLAEVHDQLRPDAYLEIGVRSGTSLALANCHALAIDPAFAITAELRGHVSLQRSSSDEYFARPDPLAPTGGRRLDLSFVDGLHLFEFAFRDFINAERHSRSTGAIIFDDVLPRNVDEAARLRHTGAWTGDVYSMIEVLAVYRPELIVLPVDTQPTGLLIVIGLDPDSTVLSDHYDEIMSRYRRLDPQPVPAAVLDRLQVLPPERILDSGILSWLAERREDNAPIREQLDELVRTSLGRAYTKNTG